MNVARKVICVVVADFKHAALFRHLKHGQVAIDAFLRRDSQAAQHTTIVDLSGDFCKPQA